MNALSDPELEKIHRDEQDARYSKLFLDDGYFAEVSSDPVISQGVKNSPFGDALPKRAAIGAFLSHKMERDVSPLEQDLARNAYAQAKFGKSAVSDEEFFGLVRGEYEWKKKRQDALGDLQIRIASKTLQDTIEGKPSDAIAPIFGEWGNAHPELRDGKNDLPYLAGALKLHQSIRDEMRGIEKPAAETLRVLTKFTNGEAIDGDVLTLAQSLASVPQDKREKAMEFVALAAKAQQLDAGGIAQFAENFGKALSRGFDFLPQGALADQERNAALWENMVSKGEMHMRESGDGNAVPVFGPYTGQLGTREMTAEERGGLLEKIQKAKPAFQIARELKNLAKMAVDPIRPLADEGTFAGQVEAGAYGLAGSLPLMGAVALHPIAGVMAYSDSEYDRIRLENPEIDPQFAQQLALVEGVGNAVLDRLQLNTLTGRLPVLGRFLDGIKGKWTRRALKAGGNIVEQNIQEGSQDLISPIVESISAAVREDMPDKDFAALMQDYVSSRPETFFAVLPLALIGGGIATHQDIKNPALDLTNDRLRQAGFSEKQRQFIAASTTPEEWQGRVELEWDKRTPENIEAGKKELADIADKAQAMQKDSKFPTRSVETLSDGTTIHRVTSPEGNIIFESQDSDAADLAFADAGRSALTRQTSGIAEAVAFISSVNQAIGRGEDVQKILTDQAPRTLLDEYNANPTPENLDRLFETVRFFGEQVTEAPQLAQYFVKASNRGAIKEGIYRSVIRVHEGADGIDVMRDFSQDNLKRAVGEGDVSIAWVRGQLETLRSLPEFSNLRTESDVDVIESFSDVAVAYLTGRTKEEQVPSGLRGFLRQMALFVKEILSRSYRLKRAIAEGKVGQNFERLLATSVGLDVEQIQAMEGEKAMRAMQREALASLESGDGSQGAELLDVFGGNVMLPDEKSPFFTEEIARVRDAVREFNKGKKASEKIPLNRIFSNDAPDPDTTLATFNENGFDFFVVDDLLQALESRIVSGRPSYGYVSNEAFADYSAGSRAVPQGDAKKQTFDNATIIGPADFSIGAYHGTPHTVDKFSLDKIGTGEGAQAYGWGLYFAESKDVARQYQENLSANRGGTTVFDRTGRELAHYQPNKLTETPQEKAAWYVARSTSGPNRLFLDARERAIKEGAPKEVVALLDEWIDAGAISGGRSGSLYTVDLDVKPEELLDWDVALSEHPEQVREAIKKLLPDIPNDAKGELIYARLRQRPYGISSDSSKSASYELYRAGIPGIRYLDGASRSDGKGSYNYVIFDESKIKITEENGKPTGANFSISKSQTNRVEKALEDRLKKNPDERLAIYERARQKFEEVRARRGTSTDENKKFSSLLQSMGELDAILSVLPPEVRGKVGGMMPLAKLGANTKEGNKAATVDKFLEKRIATIGEELEKFLQSEYREAILKTVKAARPKQGDNNVKRSTLGAKTQAFADSVYRATLLDADKTAERMAQVEAAIQATPDATDLVEEWGILNQFGDLDNRSAESLASSLTWLKSELKKGRESWRVKEQERVDRQRANAAEVVAFLGKASAKGRFKDKTALERAGQIANAILLDHASFEQVARAIFPEAIAKEFSDRLRAADMRQQEEEIRERQGILDALRQGAKDAGITTAKAMVNLKSDVTNAVRYWEGRMVKDERIAIDLAEKIVRGEADKSYLSDADLQTLRDELAALPADSRKEFITIRRVIDPGKEVKLDMSQAKAIQLLLSWDQPDVQAKMRREGWTDDSFQDLLDLTDDPVSRAMLDHARKLYGSGAAKVNPVYSRIFGMALPQVNNYAPTRFINSGDVKDIGLDGSPTATGSTPGFAKSRVSHSAKIAPADALTVMQQHIVTQSHWTAFAELAREFRAMLTTPDVREAIKQAHGQGVLETLESWADQMEQRGGNKAREVAWLNNVLGAAVSGKAVAALGFNLKTLSMQLENAVRFSLSINPREAVKALSDPSGVAESMRQVWASPAIQNRLEGGATAEAKFLFSRYSGKVTLGARIAEASMTPINWLDSAAMTLSTSLVHRAAYLEAKEAGMSDGLASQAAESAASRAIYSFAQPVTFGQKSNMENSGNILTKVFFLFMSDPRLKTAILADSVRGLATGTGNKSEHIRRIVAVEMMAVLSHVVSSAYRDAFTGDDDEEIWGIGGFARALLAAPFQGFFLIGAVFESVLSKLTGAGYFPPGTENPLLSGAESAARAVRNLPDAIDFSDPDALFKEWQAIARSLAVTPALAAPAVILNIFKPVMGLKNNVQSED